jgi:transposase
MGISRSAFVDGVRVNRTGRRTFALEYKREVVRKCRAPGASASAVALAHGLNANVVRKWMRQQSPAPSAPRSAAAPILLPVTVAAVSKSTKPAVAAPVPRRGASEGSIDIELNGARIRLQGAVDVEALRCVLRMLGQQ